MGTTTVHQGGRGFQQNRSAKHERFLSELDSRIMRHQTAISVVTGALAVLGVAAIVVGLSRVSLLLKIFSSF
jgi:hypothetical protein